MNETELFIQHEQQVFSIAHRFCSRYPHLEFEEVVGDAILHTVEAIRTWKPAKAALTTWINRVVWCNLLDTAKRDRWQKLEALPNSDFERPRRFDYRRFLFEISEDAAAVVIIAVSNNTTRGVLRQVLADLGWTKYRIQKTFEEIREAL